jgi:hypothetical protein
MSYSENPYRTWGTIAADADTNERASFIRLTYLHLAGAVLAFVALEAFLLSLPGIGEIVASVMGVQYGWLMVLGASVALMFWYMVQLVMSLTSRD